MDESGFGGNLPNRFVQLSPSQSVEQIAREEDALSLPAGEPFIGEMFGHRVTDLDPETAASRHSRLAHEKLAIQPRRAWRTDLLLKGEVRPRAFITTRRDGERSEGKRRGTPPAKARAGASALLAEACPRVTSLLGGTHDLARQSSSVSSLPALCRRYGRDRQTGHRRENSLETRSVRDKRRRWEY
jgi:hypothetical protein